MQNCLLRVTGPWVLMHGHKNNIMLSASNCAVMRVMDAHARARVLVFEKAHAQMNTLRVLNGKYTENCWAASPREFAGLH